MPSRRRLLVAMSGPLAALAGCTTRNNPPSTNTDRETPASSPSTPTTSPHPSTAVPTSVEVSDIVVRKAIRYESVMGSGGVLAGEGEQYVVASVQGPEELDDAAFTFEADGETWSPGLPRTRGAINISVAGRRGSPVGRENLVPNSPRILAFTVPSPLSASNPQVRFGGTEDREWPLPTEARDRLAAPAARFELDSLSVPESVSQGAPLSVSLTVTNVSKTAGRFLAAIYWPTKAIADDDESHVVERTLDAGETTSATVEMDTEYTTYEPETLTLEIRGHVSADRQVRVEDVTTPS